MSISRRDALMGATAAVVVAGVPTAVATKTALAGDPVIGLSDQLRDVWKAWMSAQNVYEEACHRVGFSTCYDGHDVRRELGIDPLWQEEQRFKARFWDLHARVLDMPATTTRGVLAKLQGFYDGEIAEIMAGDDPYNDLPAEWAASIYRDLERMAGEARS